MNRVVLILFCLIVYRTHSQNLTHDQKIENLKTFSRLYGYVRYFHPSDEASEINWDKFAVYGSKQVENVPNSGELLKKLNELFLPIAPSLKLFRSSEKVEFDTNSIIPKNKKEYKEIYWQHLGLGISKESIYKSVRVNRESQKTTKTNEFNSVCKQLDLSPHKNEEFVLKAHVRVVGNETKGYLWVREDLENGGTGFFYNMNDRPISIDKWEEYVIKGKAGDKSQLLNFGAYVLGEGSMFIDNISLSIKNEKGDWVEVYKNNFENDKPQKEPTDLIHGIGKGTNGLAGVFLVVSEQPQAGKNCLMLGKEEIFNEDGIRVNKPIFGFKPKPGEYIVKSINNDLSCVLPISLYGTDKNTYPIGSENQLKSIKTNLESLNVGSASDLYVRLGDVIIIYNIMQHFYPYFDVVKTDWNEAFVKALKESYDNKDPINFLHVIQKFTAQLKDGHVMVSYFNDHRIYVPEIIPEIIENKLVITSVLSKSINIPIGSVIDEVNNLSANEFVGEESQYISAPTQGWLNNRLKNELFKGNLNDSIVLYYTKPDGKKEKSVLLRNISIIDRYSKQDKSTTIKKQSTDVYYLNIENTTMKGIEDSINKFKAARAIICDLRGYPKSNHGFIKYLLKDNDTCSSWMRIPQIIYPDYQPSGFRNEGWFLKAAKPHLSSKIIFLIDGSAISYAESFMGFIEGYKLATIVGQPTAGTNGNINNARLPGGYNVVFTGMKVVKHDGSQQHGIGILPNVYVNKTIRGVIEGRDEFLEKAIEIVSDN